MANQADDKDLQLNEEEEDLQSTGVTSVLTIGGMSKVPKIRNVIEEIFKKEISDSQLEDGEISTGAIYLGVLFGDINYLDDRRTSKNRIFTMASQKMFIGDRKAVGLQNLAKHVFIFIIFPKENFFL
ncbi:unnamed protein product [Meloidogyne enterolobii]|uniref:Uncharacterized protein n=1 Tax=Meloidogyne enterolobii TaxID=390850 RepID=A0ACB0Y0T6_MELEN